VPTPAPAPAAPGPAPSPSPHEGDAEEAEVVSSIFAPCASKCDCARYGQLSNAVASASTTAICRWAKTLRPKKNLRRNQRQRQKLPLRHRLLLALPKPRLQPRNPQRRRSQLKPHVSSRSGGSESGAPAVTTMIARSSLT
jgi:hypothetical protein